MPRFPPLYLAPTRFQELSIHLHEPWCLFSPYSAERILAAAVAVVVVGVEEARWGF